MTTDIDRKKKMMKVLKYGFTIVLIVAIALLLMNGSIPKKYLKAQQDSSAAHYAQPNGSAEYQNEWRIFIRQSELMMSQNEKRIVAFKETIEEAGPKAILEYGHAVDSLEQKNSQLKRMLHAYDSKRRAERERFQSTFRRQLDSIGRHIQRVLKENG